MPARQQALLLLARIEEEGAYAHLLLGAALPEISSQDRRLVTQLVYGYLQQRGTIDACLDSLLRNGLGSLPAFVQRVLRLGCYQLFYLDKIPTYAIVHTSVEAIREGGFPGLCKLVNGVLRTAARQGFTKLTGFMEPSADLATRAAQVSVPSWMLARLEKSWGQAVAKSIASSWLGVPPWHLRVNTLRFTPEELMAKHPEMITRSPHLGESLHWHGEPEEVFAGMERGWWTIQDESSMLVAYALDPQPGEQVLDACAAPGGKMGHLAERMRDQGSLVAWDYRPHRVQLLVKTKERLGLGIVRAELQDLRRVEAAGQQFDRVLLDAPCTGWGVLRRKPELKWSAKESDAAELARLQAELLIAASRCVKPGGRLVYAVCTWTAEETVERVRAFTEQMKEEFLPDPKLLERLPASVREQGLVTPEGVQILPPELGMDGFFLAAWVRRPGKD